jgi:hypothetical protein
VGIDLNFVSIIILASPQSIGYSCRRIGTSLKQKGGSLVKEPGSSDGGGISKKKKKRERECDVHGS